MPESEQNKPIPKHKQKSRPKTAQAAATKPAPEAVEVKTISNAKPTVTYTSMPQKMLKPLSSQEP